jgi:transposase
VALLSVIRRWRLREGMAIREIARRTGLSRNTIRKYLASEVVEPKYPPRKSPSKLDAFEQTLASWLKRESGRSRKQRRNLKQLYSDLVELGYEGSYDRVAAFTRTWREQQQEAARVSGRGTFVPLIFVPGEAFQFDWSEDWAVIGGERTKLMVAQFKLCYSRAFMLRAYPLQSHEMLFDAHNHALAALGGVPKRGIYDNMKTAVDRVGRGKVREVVSAGVKSPISNGLRCPPDQAGASLGCSKTQGDRHAQPRGLDHDTRDEGKRLLSA